MTYSTIKVIILQRYLQYFGVCTKAECTVNDKGYHLAAFIEYLSINYSNPKF